MPMPEDGRPRTTLPQLVKQLAGDGVRVAEAELALSRAELAAIIRSYVKGIVIGAVAIAVLIVAMAILAQAAAIAIEPYLASAAAAYLCVGLLLSAAAGALALTANHILKQKHEPVGLIFKWFAGSGSMK